MLKTIITFSVLILAYSQNQKQADCSKIDQIIKDVDLGLKLSKIKEELQTLTKFSQELESAAQGFKGAVAFIKKLKDNYDHHKILLQTRQIAAGGVSKAQGPNSPQIAYNQLASALSEIRAVNRIYPELEKAQHIFDTMKDDVNKFRSLARDLNIQQTQIDQYLKDQNTVKQCKGKPYVLEHNIYESSSTEEEEVVQKVQAKKVYAPPPNKAQPAPPPPPVKPVRPLSDDEGKAVPRRNYNQNPIKIDQGVHKSVKGHLKHKSKHGNNKKQINVQKKD